MPADDLALLTKAAREAGKIATGFAGHTAARWDKPDGTGPVTEADLAVNAMLERDLRAARPAYGWLSEESEDTAARLSTDRVFIIDPLDGTRSFIAGDTTWAHSLAVAEQGEVTAAVIYLPLLDKLYAAARGRGATLNGVPIHAAGTTALAGATMLAARPVLDPRFWASGHAPDIERVYRPSLAYRLSLVAEGRYDAMLTLRDSWEWDIAAGDLIMREAGGVISDRFGGTLRFNNPRPLLSGIVAAAPGVHSALRGALLHD